MTTSLRAERFSTHSYCTLSSLAAHTDMDYAYALLDKGYIPDAMLRPAIRSLCRVRQREIDNGKYGHEHLVSRMDS